MSLTRDGKRIADWAEKYGTREREKACFTEIDRDRASYWEDRPDSPGIWDYGFETVPEIRKALGELWAGDEVMQEMITVSAVSLMKEKPREEERDAEGMPAGETGAGETEDVLPAYVYTL